MEKVEDLREKLSKVNSSRFHKERSRSRSRKRSPYYRKKNYDKTKSSSSSSRSRSGSRSRSRSSRYHRRPKPRQSRSRSRDRYRRHRKRSDSRRRYSRSRSRSSSRKSSRYKRKRKRSCSSSRFCKERPESYSSKTVEDDFSSSSPSPPRYDNRAMSSASLGSKRSSIFLSGKSMEECRSQIMEEMNYYREQDLLMQKNSKIETIDIESDPDTQENGKKIIIPGLGVNVTEMELRRSLNCQNRLNQTQPSKITFSKLSGKCDAILHFSDIRAADDYKKQINQSFLYSAMGPSGLSSPGVSPPRFVDTSDSIHIIETESSEICQDESLSKVFSNINVIPIFVDIQSEDGLYITKIKVNLLTHGKCQQFFGQEPKILISAFLNYMKKYYPSKEGLELVFVTPCPAAYTLFYSVLKENAVNKQVFDFYFSLHTTVQSVVREAQAGCRGITACSFQSNKG